MPAAAARPPAPTSRTTRACDGGLFCWANAARVQKKLQWDGTNFRFTNSDAANKLCTGNIAPAGPYDYNALLIVEHFGNSQAAVRQTTPRACVVCVVRLQELNDGHLPLPARHVPERLASLSLAAHVRTGCDQCLDDGQISLDGRQMKWSPTGDVCLVQVGFGGNVLPNRLEHSLLDSLMQGDGRSGWLTANPNEATKPADSIARIRGFIGES